MMAPQNSPENIIIATQNKHKIMEMQAIAQLYSRLSQTSYAQSACPQFFPCADHISWEEDRATYIENAEVKARAVQTQMPDEWVLADDSGLEVFALGNSLGQCEPGLYSARYAEQANLNIDAPDIGKDARNRLALVSKLQRLISRLSEKQIWSYVASHEVYDVAGPSIPNVKEKTPSFYLFPARFVCALVLFSPKSAGLAWKSYGYCQGHVGLSERGAQGFGYDALFFPLGYKKTFAEMSDLEKHRCSHRAHAWQALWRNFSKG